MGKRNATRVTAKDMQKAGGLSGFIKMVVKSAVKGDNEAKETAAQQLRSLAEQNHGEHCVKLYEAGAVTPAHHAAARRQRQVAGGGGGRLHSIALVKEEHQRAVIDAGIVVPLVKLLRTGSAKVQEEAASALASLASDVSHQRDILQAGAVAPLVNMLKMGSAAAQAFAAMALANAAAYDAEDGQNAIARAGAVPLLLSLPRRARRRCRRRGALRSSRTATG